MCKCEQNYARPRKIKSCKMGKTAKLPAKKKCFYANFVMSLSWCISHCKCVNIFFIFVILHFSNFRLICCKKKWKRSKTCWMRYFVFLCLVFALRHQLFVIYFENAQLVCLRKKINLFRFCRVAAFLQPILLNFRLNFLSLQINCQQQWTKSIHGHWTLQSTIWQFGADEIDAFNENNKSIRLPQSVQMSNKLMKTSENWEKKISVIYSQWN